MLAWLASPLAFIIAIIHSVVRFRRGEDKILERFGRWGNVPKNAIWVHGASVGECLSLTPLLPYLERQAPVVLTTTTHTARNLMARYHNYVRHQIWDIAPLAAHRIRRMQPKMYMMVESEIWPILMKQLYKRGVPILLLNARISTKSMDRWRKLGFLGRSIFRTIMLATTTCPIRAQFLKDMGVKDVRIRPHLKYLNTPSRSNKDKVQEFCEALNNRPVWMAASIHPGELETIIQAIEMNRQALAIVAPRHIKNSEVWLEKLRSLGFEGELYSTLDLSNIAHYQFIIVDSMGQLSTFYEISHIVCVGGSLVPGIGGHNIIEPGFFWQGCYMGPSYGKQLRYM